MRTDNNNKIKKRFFGKATGHNMINTWQMWAVKGQRLVVIDRWRALICSAV